MHQDEERISEAEQSVRQGGQHPVVAILHVTQLDYLSSRSHQETNSILLTNRKPSSALSAHSN